MCGIFGWSFKRRSRICSAQREALASTLAIANSLRGDQSWGVFYLDKQGVQHVRKQVGDIADVPGVSALGMWDIVMAHTRYATTGRVTKDNQHPFRAGSILLAHNGMVFNHYELNKTYQRSCDVDSQHFAHHLAEGREFTDIEAYGSLEWIEGTSRTVNLCRMRQGQLAVYGIKNHMGKQVGVAWSSDVAHLRSAIGAARLDAFPYVKLTEGHVYMVTNGKLFTTERKLACAAPVFDHRTWSRYQSTQGLYSGAFTNRENCKEYRWDTATGKLVEVTTSANDPIQMDEGLFVDPETGAMVDPALTGSEGEEPCDVCGSVLGYDDEGHCLDCFTPRSDESSGSSRIADMTDEQWEAYQRRVC